MSDLTKEYLDQKLDSLATKKDLESFATKEDLESSTEVIKSYVDDKVDGLARMVAAGFEEMRNLLDVRERVEHLELDLNKIKKALHI